MSSEFKQPILNLSTCSISLAVDTKNIKETTLQVSYGALDIVTSSFVFLAGLSATSPSVLSRDFRVLSQYSHICFDISYCWLHVYNSQVIIYCRLLTRLVINYWFWCSNLSIKTILFLCPFHYGPTYGRPTYWPVLIYRKRQTNFDLLLFSDWTTLMVSVNDVNGVLRSLRSVSPPPCTHTQAHARTHTLLCARSASGRILMLYGDFM